MYMPIIYKLSIGEFHYIGRTITRFSTRYNAHKKSCFNRSKKSYWTKLYVKIRGLGVKKNQWEEKVKYKILYKDCADDEIDFYEMSCININHPYNLNTMSKTITEFYLKPLTKWGQYSQLPIEEQNERRRVNEKIYKKTERGKSVCRKKKEKYRKTVSSRIIFSNLAIFLS